MREALLLEVGLQRFERIFPDQQLAQVLEVRQPLEKENALDQSVGVLHLVDRFFFLVLFQLVQPPIAEHAGVQEVLIDGSELVEQHLVQVLHHLGVALHHRLLGCESVSEATRPPPARSRTRRALRAARRSRIRDTVRSPCRRPAGRRPRRATWLPTGRTLSAGAPLPRGRCRYTRIPPKQ